MVGTMSPASTTIGRFKVLGELGRGAMGVVYLAEDPLLKRSVAIKVVRGDAATQGDALVRFQKEAEISARLSHPGVVTVFDVGEESGLGPFMAMEYVEGEPLSAEVQRGPLRPERAVLLLVQGVHALEAAHGAGIIHRDVKPENFMVSRAGSLKLMDFGIARRSENPLTTTSLMCTPSFTAPELLEHQAPSEASDSWAFAVTVYNCLTGALPFESASLSGLLYQIAHEPPTLAPGMDLRLAEVFIRAFQKRPQDRHPSLRTFFRELMEALPLDAEVWNQCQALLEMPITSSLGATSTLAFAHEGVRRFRSRQKTLLWSAGVLAVVMLAGAWAGGLFSARRLTITSSPAGARVRLDDADLGATPISEAKIPRKAQRLWVEKPGYLSLDRPLGRKDRVLDLKLIPVPLTLPIKTEPAGAEVFLNGSFMGITPLAELQMPREGLHTLMVRKTGHEVWSSNLSREHLPPDVITLKRTKAPVKAPEPGFWGSLKNRAKKAFGGD